VVVGHEAGGQWICVSAVGDSVGVYWFLLYDPNGFLERMGWKMGGAMGLAWAYLITYVLQTLYMIPFILLMVRRKMNRAGGAVQQGESVVRVASDEEM
jgi:tryptophan-rich sensory protein